MLAEKFFLLLETLKAAPIPMEASRG